MFNISAFEKEREKKILLDFFSYLFCLCYINNVYLDPIQVSMNSDCYWADDLFFFFLQYKKRLYEILLMLCSTGWVFMCVCVLLLIFIRCICMISCSCSVYTILWIRILNKTIYKSVCVYCNQKKNKMRWTEMNANSWNFFSVYLVFFCVVPVDSDGYERKNEKNRSSKNKLKLCSGSAHKFCISIWN